jgi:membrane protease YdiL (CAAX protease family)
VTALDVLKQLVNSINTSHVVSLIGIGLFSAWLIRTSLGRKSLVQSRPRRNNMLPVEPFIPFILWFLGAQVLLAIMAGLIGPVGAEGEALEANITFCVVGVLTLGLILPLARYRFARGLKGFGLNLGTVARDIGAAFLKLLAVWPLVLATIIVTTTIGRLLQGPSYELPRHQELQVMAEFSSTPLRVLVIAMAVVMAPLLEEMLFRGLLQSVIRSYVNRPWLAIAITSALFALVHADAPHWPALFVLAMGLGYAYERSGSLFQSIFMHAFFNGMVIAASLAG